MYKIKIRGILLLIIYLFVSIHQIPADVHSSVFTPPQEHQHENYTDIHHQHHFHVGIFHFLGHLFEFINHTDDLADDHLLLVQKSSSKKVVVHNNTVNPYMLGQHLLVFEVDAESLPDPPYYLFLLKKLKLPSTPLRAPPSLV